VAVLLKRHGWTCQVPARRAVERDEQAVADWVKRTWPQVEGDAWLVFEDEAGFTLMPSAART
jgi:hypothetical protein